MTEYYKAIRDKIPKIIESSGNSCRTKTLSDDEFIVELEKKLNEEMSEYQETKSVEELADILEVIFRIAELRGTDNRTLEEIRKNKNENRGRFTKNLFLIDTIEKVEKKI